MSVHTRIAQDLLTGPHDRRFFEELPIAQVRATLAGAVEQRTANLIAFAAVRGETPAGKRALREAGHALGLYTEGVLDHGDRD